MSGGDELRDGLPGGTTVVDRDRVDCDAFERSVDGHDDESVVDVELQIGGVPGGGDQDQCVDSTLDQRARRGALPRNVITMAGGDESQLARSQRSLDLRSHRCEERVRHRREQQADRAAAATAGERPREVVEAVSQLRRGRLDAIRGRRGDAVLAVECSGRRLEADAGPGRNIGQRGADRARHREPARKVLSAMAAEGKRDFAITTAPLRHSS